MVKSKKTNKTRVLQAKDNPAIPIFLIAMVVPLVYLAGAWTTPLVASPMTIKACTAQIYLSALIAYWFWIHRDNKKDLLEYSLPSACFAALFVFGTASILWTINVDFFIYKWLKWYCAAIMFFFGLQIEQNEKNLSIVFNCIVAAGVGISVIGIAQYLFAFDILPQNTVPASTFGNSNVAGQAIVLSAPFTLYFLFKAHLSKSAAWVYALATCLILTYAFYTRTRAIWIACSLEFFLIALMFIFDRTKRKDWFAWNRDKTIASVVASLLFCLLVNLTEDGFQPFWPVIEFEVSTMILKIQSVEGPQISDRYVLWGSALEMIRDNPVAGTGLGSFYENFNNGGYNNQVKHAGTQRAHNDVIELGVELGAIGWFLLMGIIVSMCLCLLRLKRTSVGPLRLVYMLLTATVTASMFNAQVSFPYQVPVPLVLVPLFVAILIRGSELLNPEPVVIKYKVGSWYSRTTLAVCSLLFVLISIVNVQWMRAFHNLSNGYNYASQLKPWSTNSWVFSQDLITTIRFVSAGTIKYGAYRLGINFMAPLIKYWPNEPINASLMAELYINLQLYDEAEKWAQIVVETQPEMSYGGEHFLIHIYDARGDLLKMREMYDFLRSQPEEYLLLNTRHYLTLHTLSILLQDIDRTPLFYKRYRDNFAVNAAIEANMAVYHVINGNIQDAIPHMQRALELDTDISNADFFWHSIKRNPEPTTSGQSQQLLVINKESIQENKVDPLVRIFSK